LDDRGGSSDLAGAARLVPGDIVSVSGGEILPADMLLVDGKYLSVDQAALTGKSLPVSKGVDDTAHPGSVAKPGAMTGLVTATGKQYVFRPHGEVGRYGGAKSHAEQAVLRRRLPDPLAAVLIGAQVWHDIVAGGAWNWALAGSIAQFVSWCCWCRWRCRRGGASAGPVDRHLARTRGRRPVDGGDHKHHGGPALFCARDAPAAGCRRGTRSVCN
jgi:hypothetical protein